MKNNATIKPEIREIGSDWEIISSKSKRENKSKKKEFVPLEYFNLGFYLITPLLVGVIGGNYLDRLLVKKPIFVITGILLGTISSFYNLIKLTKKNK